MCRKVLKLSVLLLCALAVIVLSGCRINISLGDDGFFTGEEYPNSEKYQVGEATYSAEDVTAVEVYWRSGQVEINEREDGQLTAKESGGELSEDKAMHWLLENGVLKIRFCRSGVKQLIIDSADKYLSLEVPKNIDVSLHTTSADIKANSLEQKSLLVSAHSGNTELGIVTVDSADLSSSSGEFFAESLAARALKCAATSGTVSFKSVSADEINCVTTSGNVDMYRVSAEKASLATTSGKIDYAPKSVQNTDITSTSGRVDLKVPSDGAELSFASTSGKLRTDLAYGRKGDLYVFGNGQSSVSVNTTSGDVTVK